MAVAARRDHRPVPHEAPATAPEIDESLERNLAYCGMVGIIDPPRPETANAIAEPHRAGVRVMMITGDHPPHGGPDRE